MGGFVRWHMGSDKYGIDSLAKQIVPASYWPEMRILVLVVRKEIFFMFINNKNSRNIYKIYISIG